MARRVRCGSGGGRSDPALARLQSKNTGFQAGSNADSLALREQCHYTVSHADQLSTQRAQITFT
jgi:hypothetical protein